ncbi:MAG: ATP-binding protein [Nanoarchaeota archaeon]
MLLGRITGKITTTRFTFEAEKEAKKFEYVQVYHKEVGYVLCQIVEIERANGITTAICHVLGFKDEDGRIRNLRQPFEPDSEVLVAQDDFIREIIKLEESDKGAYLGKLEGRNIPIHLDLQKLLTKHLAILAKSGAGKSYCVGVLLEEIMERNVPLLIIDPHGEYHSLKYKNEDDKERMAKFDVKPKGYLRKVQKYGDHNFNNQLKPLLLSDELRADELVQLLPSKLSSSQQALLFSALKQVDYFTFANLRALLEQQDSNAKWQVIAMVDYLENLKIFSKSPTSYNELVQTGKCSIINLKGIAPDVQGIIVYKLLKDLFEQRKKNTVPPFFCVIEEAHNFCPERTFAQVKSGEVIRTIASEGRKFGMGLAVISQRPARVEKSVLSQITTQIILKITNPNDLKTISNSIEGITSESVQEIQNLPIGSGLITGVVDMPLFVNIRPRRTMHGGDTVDILAGSEEKDFMEEVKDFDEQGIMPLIFPKMSKKDATIMSSSGNVKTVLIPAALFVCEGKQGKYSLLAELVNGTIVANIDDMQVKRLPNLEDLNPDQIKVLEKAFFLKKFSFEQFIAKTKMPLDTKEVLDFLVGKEYLVKFSDSSYGINDSIILSHLSKYECFEKIQFKAIPTDEHLRKNVRLDSMKAKIARFSTVSDMRECSIVRYIDA